MHLHEPIAKSGSLSLRIQNKSSANVTKKKDHTGE